MEVSVNVGVEVQAASLMVRVAVARGVAAKSNSALSARVPPQPFRIPTKVTKEEPVDREAFHITVVGDPETTVAGVLSNPAEAVTDIKSEEIISVKVAPVISVDVLTLSVYVTGSPGAGLASWGEDSAIETDWAIIFVGWKNNRHKNAKAPKDREPLYRRVAKGRNLSFFIKTKGSWRLK